MKDVCKRPETSKFWIIKVASFKISNPDSMGVNLKAKIRAIDSSVSLEIRWVWTLSKKVCQSVTLVPIRRQRLKIKPLENWCGRHSHCHHVYRNLELRKFSWIIKNAINKDFKNFQIFNFD